MSRITILLTIGIFSALQIAEIPAFAGTNCSSKKEAVMIEKKRKRPPRGSRGPRGHKGKPGERGKRGEDGSQGPQGPNALPTNPIGAGIYFTAIPSNLTFNPGSITASTWTMLPIPTLDLTSWNSLYTGASFTNNGFSRLTYTGTTPITVLIRAIFAAGVGNNVTFSSDVVGFGIGINGVPPTSEQEVNVTTAKNGGIGSTFDFTSKIILTLNPGDYIEPFFFSEAAIPNLPFEGRLLIGFLKITVSEWNGLN